MKELKIVSMPEAPHVHAVETADAVYINNNAGESFISIHDPHFNPRSTSVERLETEIGQKIR